MRSLTIPQFIDSLAIRIDGPKAWDLRLVTDWQFTDLDEHYRVTLENGVLSYTTLGLDRDAAVDAAFTLTKPRFMALLAGRGLDGVATTGNPEVLATLMGVLDDPDPNFAVVTR